MDYNISLYLQFFGVAVLALAVYLFVKDFADIEAWELIINPATLLVFFGFSICIISMMGSLGALRDNIFLLKCFAISVFACYLLTIIFTFSTFVVFFTDSLGAWSAQELMLFALKKYHSNRNLAEIVDAIQNNLQCCGVSSIGQGYRDWGSNRVFNCSLSNPQPEKCGVPFSCCRKSVLTEAAGSSNPLLPAMRSLQCWQNALNRQPIELEHDIYTRGCLAPLRAVLETNAVHIGIVMALVIVPVCVLVCLTNILAKQIDHQHYLLEREALRNERRRKRKQSRQRREVILVENEETNVQPTRKDSQPIKSK
ncbi:unnamed protein product [Auanema sp. JU1783]|nr:unnamed protein product [Auanema sp. JU1783]